MKTLTTLAISLTIAATTAFAKPPLRDVTQISEGLIIVGMAYELGRKCDSVSPRMIRGLNFLHGLKNEARALGYSDAEIDAFVDDRAEKSRLEGVARERLVALGVQPNDRATYCTVASAQMSEATQVGQLLR